MICAAIFLLASDRVDRHRRPAKVQQLQQLRDRGDLVVLRPAASCPSTSRFSPHQALIMCNAALPSAWSNERRIVLPSTASSRPSLNSAIAETQSMKQRSNAAGSSIAPWQSYRPTRRTRALTAGKAARDIMACIRQITSPQAPPI